MRSIFVIAPVHPADDVRVYSKQVRAMINNGFSVSLLAQPPWGASIDPRVKLISVPNFDSRGQRFLFLVRVLWLALRSPADLIYCHNPDTLPVVFICKLFGKNVAYDTHENFLLRIRSRIWIPKWLRGPLAFVVHKAEVLASYVADLVIVTQRAMMPSFNPKKTILVANPPLVPTHAPRVRSARSSDVVRLGYMGGISMAREIHNIVDQLPMLNQQGAVVLDLIGPVNAKYLNDLQGSLGWQYVNFHGKLSQDQGFNILRAVDFGLIILPDSVDFRFTSPNKLFEYCALGIPFIASDFPDWKTSFGSHDVGYFIDPSALETIGDILDQFRTSRDVATDKGTRGYAFVRDVFNWSVIEPSYISRVALACE